MSTFTMIIHDGTGATEYPNVASFVGEDASGSFGILAGHVRMTTALVIGLARFRLASGEWQFLAMPGAILFFAGGTLTLTTRRCLVSDDYMQISAAFGQVLREEEEALARMRASLHRMEEEMLRRLWALGRDRL